MAEPIQPCEAGTTSTSAPSMLAAFETDHPTRYWPAARALHDACCARVACAQDNSAANQGGALYIETLNGSLIINNTRFQGNTGGLSGGAFFVTNSSARTVVNGCTFTVRP